MDTVSRVPFRVGVGVGPGQEYSEEEELSVDVGLHWELTLLRASHSSCPRMTWCYSFLSPCLANRSSLI